MMEGWDWVGGLLMMIAFWSGIAVVIVIAVRAFGTTRGRAEHPDAKAILRNRYARGEISEDEFGTRMSVLDSRAA